MLGKTLSILSLKFLTDDSKSIKLEAVDISAEKAEVEWSKIIDIIKVTQKRLDVAFFKKINQIPPLLIIYLSDENLNNKIKTN